MIKLRSTPVSFTILSLIAMTALVMTTSPATNILYSVVFFLLAYIFLISLGYLIGSLGGHLLSAKAKRRLKIIAAFIVITAMFQSTKSLNWISALTLLILALGFLFYSDRRGIG